MMNGVEDLAKKQKTALLDESVCSYIDVLQRGTGATYARLITASLLKFAFSPWSPPPGPFIAGNDNTRWTTLAVDIERGEVKPENIPDLLLNTSLAVCEQLLDFYSKPESKRSRSDLELSNVVAVWNRRKEAYLSLQRHWNNLVAESGTKGDALAKLLQRGVVPIHPNMPGEELV